MQTDTAHQTITAPTPPVGQAAERHAAGAVTAIIETQAARVPSGTFLWVAASAIGASLVMQVSGRRHASMFVGQWVAPFLLLGVYSRLVRMTLAGAAARSR